jgi:hypothetical protein
MAASVIERDQRLSIGLIEATLDPNGPAVRCTPIPGAILVGWDSTRVTRQIVDEFLTYRYGANVVITDGIPA